MTTQLTVRSRIDHSALEQRFSEDPGTWLPAPARPSGLDTWRVELFAGVLHRTVIVAVGPPWRIGTGTWRALRWEAVTDAANGTATDAALPVFVGELGVHRTGQDTVLELRGSYEPPGGAVGRTADRAVLHHVARTTAQRLVDDIARRLVAEAPAAHAR